ncbi:hypothetical protein [Nocardia jiangxiensis]|uniref:hypothetical protein n=1 Tax=Nocardia jiangxiensis TaxID=282685 RepID=UPI00030CFBF4|nr:hypothetical protein [Nocardia jiangxiensis]
MRKILLDLREMIVELQLQVTRQSKGAPAVGRGSGDPVLPFDVHASEVFDDLIKTLASWYGGVSEVDPLVLQGLDPVVKAHKLVDWHLRHYITVSRFEDGGLYFDDLRGILGKSMHAIGRRQPKMRLGECTCGRPVQARADQKAVACACGVVWGVGATRAAHVAQGAEQLVTAREAAQLGEISGRQLKPGTIQTWRRRGRLRSEGKNHSGEYLFRFGDIVALARS